MSSVLISAATSASYNMVLQLLFRLLTFVLNAFVLRYISKDLLGVVNVRLTLLYSTILFMSREAFRRACLSKTTANKQWTQLINLLWIILPIGLVLSAFFAFIWSNVLEQPDESKVTNYQLAVVLFASSAVVELLSEPLFITAQILLYVKLKVVIEGFAILLRCLLTVVLVLLQPEKGVINFCVAQLSFTCTVSISYYLYFIYSVNKKQRDEHLPFHSVRDFFPKIHKPYLSYDLSLLTWSFAKQSIVKQVLNEGERYVMTVFNVIKLAEQGVFDVVSNLGCLPARFIFLPLEDSGYLFFSQTLVRGQPAVKQEEEALQLSINVLRSLLKFVIWIGLTMLSFGYSYSHLFLDLYGGSILSSGAGPPLLRWYCAYVVLMAINGITECFASATMNEAQLDSFNKRIFCSTALYLASLKFLCQIFGSVGLILGNCLVYLARISFSIHHINGFFKDSLIKPLNDVFPKLTVIITMFLCWMCTAFSEVVFCCDKGVVNRLMHIFFGGLCLLGLLLVTYLKEVQLISFVKQQYIKQKTKRS